MLQAWHMSTGTRTIAMFYLKCKIVRTCDFFHYLMTNNLEIVQRISDFHTLNRPRPIHVHVKLHDISDISVECEEWYLLASLRSFYVRAIRSVQTDGCQTHPFWNKAKVSNMFVCTLESNWVTLLIWTVMRTRRTECIEDRSGCKPALTCN